MNIIILISIGIVSISFLGMITLFKRLKELHSEKPHVIPSWVTVLCFLGILVHLLSLGVLLGIYFYPEFLPQVLSIFSFLGE